jgi:hypothetical protein
MACVDALLNGAAIGTRASALVWAILTHIAPFLGEKFTGWRVPFLRSEPALWESVLRYPLHPLSFRGSNPQRFRWAGNQR